MGVPLTLLIVDGHEGVRTALVRRLQRTPGVAVVGAVADVATAVQVSRQLTPDVVLWEPRTIEGDPLCALRALVGTGHPVVVWTSSLVQGEAEALVRAGAAAVLLKNTNLSPLREALGVAITPRQSAPSCSCLQAVQRPYPRRTAS